MTARSDIGTLTDPTQPGTADADVRTPASVRSHESWRTILRQPIWRWILGITTVKLIAAWWAGGTADIPQTLAQARAFLAGHDVLNPEQMQGNPSFFLLGHYAIAAACVLVSEATRLPFAFIIKIPAILSDAVVAAVLCGVPRGGVRVALAYLINPVTLLLSVYHGQLHTVAMAGAVVALWCAEQGRSLAAGMLLGAAASVRQHFALFLMPLLARTATRRGWLVVGFSAAMLAINTWLLVSAHPQRVLAPTWTYGSWGYAMVLGHSARVLTTLHWDRACAALEMVNALLRAHGPLIYWAWATLFSVWSLRTPRRDDVWRSATVFLTGLYAVSPGFGVQWLVWVIPFWLIADRPGALRYSYVAGAFLAGSYWQWGLNAAYGVRSITADLTVLSRRDLAGVIAVGACGVLTWLCCVRTAWRLARGSERLAK